MASIGTMRIGNLLALAVIVPFFSCTHEGDPVIDGGTQYPERPGILQAGSPGVFKRAFDFDIVQRTCAMYVALRSAAFNAPVAFDRSIDDTMVHWNKCPSGNMVACAEPSPLGDTTRLGIPFPY